MHCFELCLNVRDTTEFEDTTVGVVRHRVIPQKFMNVPEKRVAFILSVEK
jgi:hypothetical protein